ncbi:MAG: hypothetical protein WBC05_03880 [Sedimentisphaerales bacterium]
MKNREVYESWKQAKSQIDVSQNFTGEVMDQINAWEQSRNFQRFNVARFVELVSFHPLAKTGLVAVGAATGIVRLIIMIHTILSNGVING